MNLITTYNRNRSLSNILQTLSGFTKPEIDWPLSDREDSVSYTTHIKEDDQDWGSAGMNDIQEVPK